MTYVVLPEPSNAVNVELWYVGSITLNVLMKIPVSSLSSATAVAESRSLPHIYSGEGGGGIDTEASSLLLSV